VSPPRYGREEEAKECEAMMDQAYDLLRRRNAPEALKIGQQLERRRYSGGFEIQARALVAVNRRKAAIETLERGVAAVPGNWALWQFLGSCRSDDEDYEGAFAAYEKSLTCDGYEPEILYNYATASRRADRWEKAKALIEPLFDRNEIETIEPPRLALYLINLYEEILRKEGRDEEAIAMVQGYAAVIARGVRDES
jgi:Flp pilus assembly protein TadD